MAVAVRNYIGGSDAAAVCGLDPYRTPVHVWLEKTHQVEPRDAGEAASWGKKLEPLLAEAVEEHGYAVMPAPDEPFVHREYEWMVGHVDGFVLEADANPRRSVRGVLELKTASLRFSSQWDDGQVPVPYQAQVQHYLAVTERPFAVVGCLIGGQSFVVRRIERDEEAIALITEREAHFWNLVQTNTPPPPDGSPASTDLLKRLYPQAAGGIVTLDHLGGDLLERYQEARKHAKRWAEEEQAIENQVKAELKDADVGTLAGSPAFTWKSHLTHRLDQKALREELPDVFQVYNREVEQRRFVGVRR